MSQKQFRPVVALIACVVVALIGAPAHAQYQYMGQSASMAVGAASGLIRTVPMMATGLVRLVPHHLHKNKNNNNNNVNNFNNSSINNGNFANNNMQNSGMANAQQGQGFGTTRQVTGNFMQANAEPNAQPNFNNVPQQNYSMQAAQPPMQSAQAQMPNVQAQYNNAPGLVPNAQSSFGAASGQAFESSSQGGYGTQGTLPAYVSNPAQ